MAKIQKITVKKYPDISKIFRAKEERRMELARLPITKKFEMASRMKEAAKLIKNSKRIDIE